MKAIEKFNEFRNKKIKFSLKSRLTVLVAAEILVSIGISAGIVTLLEWLFPSYSKVPSYVQTGLIIFLIVVIATRIFAKVFFDPIKKIREAMHKVSGGDFSVRLNSKSSSVEIQEMYAGFNMMTQELEATEILQSDFVSNVSHEFKTPINAIEGYTTLLQDCENLDEDQKEYVDKILFNTKRLSTLVGNILLLSKIENQAIQTHTKEFRLDEQIRQSILGLEPAWEPKNIDFDVELEKITYCGNDTLMHHVWDNLIGNAVKFTPDYSTVKIRLYEEADNIIFTVEDSGPGISPEAKTHLFDKFYQEDSSHKQEGNGLGLALVKRILSTAQGEISVRNIEGGGCEFSVGLRKVNNC